MSPTRLILAAATAFSLSTAAGSASRNTALDSGSPIRGSWAATSRFAALIAAGPDNVRVSSGDRWQVRAEGDPRTLAQLRFLVKKSSLTVGRRSGSPRNLPTATIYVTAPAIRAATLAGSGAVHLDRLTGDTVGATVAGSGDMTIGSIAVRTLNGTVAGSGDLTVAGRAADARLTVAGSGRLAGAALTADRAALTSAGSGTIALHSDGEVSATITGSGNVEVIGRAHCRQVRVGTGSLRCAG